MLYNYVFTGTANSDLIQSIEYYNDKKEELGVEFLLYVKEHILKIRTMPYSYPQYGNKGIRKYVISRFPFAIYYQILEEHHAIRILAVYHTSRNPLNLKLRV